MLCLSGYTPRRALKVNMEQKTINTLLSLLYSAVSTEVMSEQDKKDLSAEEIQEAIKLAASHDLGHLVAYGAKKNGLSKEIGADGEGYIFKAVYRHQQIKYELDRLSSVLEKNGIPFLPLKGSVIRKHYPEPWMRTSCDIDILVHNEDMEKARAILEDELKYKYEDTYSHDLSFFSPANVHVEMHFDLIEEGAVNESASVLRSVWDDVTLKDGYSYWYEMPDSLFYFYHVAHMAKHVLNGGCGIKPFIDQWILDNMPNADKEAREELLNRGNLAKFCEVASGLSAVWFGKGAHDEFTDRLEEYVLSGGTYGSNEHRMVLQRRKKGSRIKYILSIAFPPYSSMKKLYPILQKHRWLTVIMHGHRLISKLFFRSRMRRAKKILTQINNISNDDLNCLNSFLQDVGLAES